MKKFYLGAAVVAIVLLGAGCLDEATSNTGSYAQTSNQVKDTQQKLQTAVPIPQLATSAERENIASRAKLFDDTNKVSYIYLISYGKVMAFYTVKGKVSSLNSYLTPLEQLVFGDGSPCTEGGYVDSPDCYVVSSPDIDGAYGENAGGVFFFTTEGAYVEWSGEYMMSDFPLQLSTPPELVRQIK